jgi:competence ComEA-like helix-hairpin-helix protein
VGLYTRRQLLLLFALAAAAGLGLAIGHWRARHPLAVEHVESLDRGRGPIAAGRAIVPVGASPRRNAGLARAAGETDIYTALGPVPASRPVPPSAEPGRPGAPPRPRKPGRALPGDPPPAPIDINQASVEDLTRLPGVGPALASRIVKARADGGPFTRVDDLRRVRGVGPAALERLRAHVTVAE